MRNHSRVTITIKDDLLKSVDKLVDGSKIKNRSHAIESLLLQNFKSQKIKKAVILAGGEGVSVQGYEKPVSRILSLHNKKPFAEYIFDWLKKQGIEEVIISAGSLSSEIKDEIGDGSQFGLQISYLAKDTGTASVLKYLPNIIAETFLMMNGDVLCDIDLGEMLDFHKKTEGVCTIAMVSVKEPSALGTIKLSGNRIVDFIEKPEKGKEESYLINAGIYLMDPNIFSEVSLKCSSLEKNLFPYLAKEEKLFGYHLQSKWFHLDSGNNDKK